MLIVEYLCQTRTTGDSRLIDERLMSALHAAGARARTPPSGRVHLFQVGKFCLTDRNNVDVVQATYAKVSCKESSVLLLVLALALTAYQRPICQYSHFAIFQGTPTSKVVQNCQIYIVTI